MSPIRKDKDYRSTEIKSWDDYVQEEIAEMQARGEFDNLPDQGKPLKIWKTEINPEYDLAFSRMKNAGVVPLWMELDRDIGRMTEALWNRLDEVEAEIRSMVELLKTASEPETAPQGGPLQRFRQWFRQDFRDHEAPKPTITMVMALRERARMRFIAQATELDKKIVTYHDSLPTGGEHLQRFRWLPERAARVFDDRIALTSWWEEGRSEYD